ncbi:MAG: hypothetical protein R2744_05725 [Bacteroidales bacterium]
MRSSLQKVVSVAFLSVLMLPLFGQKGIEDGSKYGHGEDSVNCRRNMSLYKTYYDQRNYAMALTFWRPAFYECPTSSFNLHLHGIRMFKAMYGETTERAYVDSMNMVYDARIKFFGEEGRNEFRRGIDLWDLGQDGDKEFLQAAYASFTKAVEIDKQRSDAQGMIVYMAVTQKLFDLGVLDNEQVINTYGKIMDILDARITAVNRQPDIDAKANVDMIFKAGGAATCDGLVKYFTPKVTASPQDVDLLKKVLSLLQGSGCAESDLYYNSAENLYKVEKSSTSAYHLAEMNFDRKQMEKAEYYYKQAIEMETDANFKSSYYTKLAAIRLNEKDNKGARDYAKSAIQLNPSNGTAYMLVGNSYAGVKIGSDDFENQTVYWVAVDYFLKAKQVDPNLASNVSEYITTYSGFFPTKTECFFRSITEEGTSYNVGGWINETTTVRFRKE